VNAEFRSRILVLKVAQVQLAVEYDPRPPFDAGSPSKAPGPNGGLRAIIAHHAAVPAPPGGL